MYLENQQSVDGSSVDDPTYTFYPGLQGRTCMAPVTPEQTCTLGGYPSFVVNATSVAKVQLAVNFARNSNVRLIVKNKGHDFNGNSAAAGALSIWTHHLRDIRFYPDYSFGSYSGPAMKLGAGVTTLDVYNLAHDLGVTIVGGQCRVGQPQR
jgi:FAD/FMN-containing dehydrogenase